MRIVTCLVVMMLAACGAGNGDTTETDASNETTTSAPEGTTVPPADDGDQAIEAKARADLASRLEVEDSSIETVSTEQVTWSDGSLGCPESGMSYTQALVEGSRTVLEHDGRFYDYHAGEDDEPFLCESDAEDGGHDSVPPLEGVA